MLTYDSKYLYNLSRIVISVFISISSILPVHSTNTFQYSPQVQRERERKREREKEREGEREIEKGNSGKKISSY